MHTYIYTRLFIYLSIYRSIYPSMHIYKENVCAHMRGCLQSRSLWRYKRLAASERPPESSVDLPQGEDEFDLDVVDDVQKSAPKHKTSCSCVQLVVPETRFHLDMTEVCMCTWQLHAFRIKLPRPASAAESPNRSPMRNAGAGSKSKRPTTRSLVPILNP